MFRITKDPSSGSLHIQYLAKNYKNGSIVSVDMDVVGFMAAYSNPMCVCAVHCQARHSSSLLHIELHAHIHTHIVLQYAAITPTTSMSMDT